MEDEDKILDDIDKANASSDLVDAFKEPFESDNLSKSMFEALPGVFDDPTFGDFNRTVVGGAVDVLDLGLRTIESGVKGGATAINEAKNYITGQDDDRLKRDLINFFVTAGVGGATSGSMKMRKGISELAKSGKKDDVAKVILAESDAFKNDNLKTVMAMTAKREPSLVTTRKKSKLRTLFDDLPESERALLPKQADEFGIAGYHGTSKSREAGKPFFDISFGRKQDEFLGEGFYFTLDPKVASEYSNMRAINQLDIIGKQGGQGLYSYRPTGQKVTTSTLLKGVDVDGKPIPVGQQVGKFDLSNLEKPYVVKTTKDRIYLKENFQKIKDEGYDSVLFDNFKDRSKQIMVFPEHIGKVDEGSGVVKQATTSGERYIPKEFNDLRKDATIKIDSPAGKDVLTGETYVEKKIRQNKEYMERNPNASPVGLYEGITGRADNVKFNPKELQGIKGEMGEDAFRMTGDADTGMYNKLKGLEEKIKKEGYKPTNIKITVTEDGTPYVTEGNHRLAEALKSDRPFITADINYLRGGEAVDGPLNPKSIGIGSGEKQKSGLMAMTTKREPSPVREMTKLEQVISDVPKADADKLDDIDLYKFMDNFESKYDDFDLALEQSKLPKEQLNKAEIDFMDRMSNIDKIYRKRREKNLAKYKELDKHAESADYKFTEAVDSAYDNAAESVDETAEEIFGRAMSKEELSPIKERGNLIFDRYFFSSLDSRLADMDLTEDYNFFRNLDKAIDKNRGGLMARN